MGGNLRLDFIRGALALQHRKGDNAQAEQRNPHKLKAVHGLVQKDKAEQ